MSNYIEQPSTRLNSAQQSALIALQSALSKATDCGLFDEFAAHSHPDRINAFCDDLDGFALAEGVKADTEPSRRDVSNCIEPSSMTAEAKSSLVDGEVLGQDADGGLIQWNATARAPYNSGETVEEFGGSNLSEAEMKRLNMSNYIEHPESGQPQEHFLNTDPSVIEAKVMKDYAHFLGKDVLVSRISGFVGDDSTDIELSPPAKVRVEATSEQSLKRWIDGWCDPAYEVVLVEDHPQLAGVRSLWIHGPSLHLNGKQTEVSDIVSIAEPIAPRYDDTPSP